MSQEDIGFYFGEEEVKPKPKIEIRQQKDFDPLDFAEQVQQTENTIENSQPSPESDNEAMLNFIEQTQGAIETQSAETLKDQSTVETATLNILESAEATPEEVNEMKEAGQYLTTQVEDLKKTTREEMIHASSEEVAMQPVQETPSAPTELITETPEEIPNEAASEEAPPKIVEETPLQQEFAQEETIETAPAQKQENNLEIGLNKNILKAKEDWDRQRKDQITELQNINIEEAKSNPELAKKAQDYVENFQYGSNNVSDRYDFQVMSKLLANGVISEKNIASGITKFIENKASDDQVKILLQRMPANLLTKVGKMSFSNSKSKEILRNIAQEIYKKDNTSRKAVMNRGFSAFEQFGKMILMDRALDRKMDPSVRDEMMDIYKKIVNGEDKDFLLLFGRLANKDTFGAFFESGPINKDQARTILTRSFEQIKSKAKEKGSFDPKYVEVAMNAVDTGILTREEADALLRI